MTATPPTMSHGVRPAAATEPSRNPPSTGALSHRALRDWLGAGSLMALLVCYTVATQSLVLGSREGGWVYGYVAVFNPRMLMMAAAATALAAVLIFAFDSRPESSRSDWVAILAWIVVALGLQALMRTLNPFSFERLFASDAANAFYGVTEHYRA